MTRVPRVRPFVPQPIARLLFIASFAAVPMLVVAQSRDPRLVQSPALQDPGRDPLGYAVVTDRDWSDDIPAHLATVDGAATLERDGHVERAQENVPLLAGDRLRTDRGRLQVLFADGSSLDLDEFSAIDLLDDALVRLQSGRVRLAIVRSADSLDYRVDAAGTTTFILASGEYRVSVGDPRVEAPEVRVAVLRGSRNSRRRLVARRCAGMEAATTSQSSPSQPYGQRGLARRVRSVGEISTTSALGRPPCSALPAELQCERHVRSIRLLDAANAVTCSTGRRDRALVSVSMAAGRIARLRLVLGWWRTLGLADASLRTLGLHVEPLVWIPERHWAPAWVSWAYAPGAGWCPLGYNNLPAVPVGHIGAYRGWTVMPSRAWGSNVPCGRTP